MAINGPSLILPPKEYSQRDEIQFRRDLEEKIAAIASRLEALYSGSSPQGSLASKRENMLSVPVGIQEYS